MFRRNAFYPLSVSPDTFQQLWGRGVGGWGGGGAATVIILHATFCDGQSRFE